MVTTTRVASAMALIEAGSVLSASINGHFAAARGSEERSFSSFCAERPASATLKPSGAFPARYSAVNLPTKLEAPKRIRSKSRSDPEGVFCFWHVTSLPAVGRSPMASASAHFTSLSEGNTVFSSGLGSITEVTAESLPILRGLSAKRLLLESGAIREPHWHANASELTYCLRGELLVGILGDGSEFSWITIGQGQMFYAPSGSLHYIENTGDSTAELIVAFSHEDPQYFSLRASVGAMSDAVLGNTWGLPASAFAALEHSTDPAWIVSREGGPQVPSTADFGSPLKFDVEAESPPICPTCPRPQRTR